MLLLFVAVCGKMWRVKTDPREHKTAIEVDATSDRIEAIYSIKVSTPLNPNQLIQGWHAQSPRWLQEAFHKDSLVNRIIMDCAHRQATTDEMRWELCRALYERGVTLQEQLIWAAMKSSHIPVVMAKTESEVEIECLRNIISDCPDCAAILARKLKAGQGASSAS